MRKMKIVVLRIETLIQSNFKLSQNKGALKRKIYKVGKIMGSSSLPIWITILIRDN